MKEGTVKFFNKTKGFGFITEKDTNEDIFVHITGLNQNVKDSDHVRFEVESSPKGPNAINVELV